MDWYNGYSPQERAALGRAPWPAEARKPPCALCGDPTPKTMQTHAEDYAKPFRWEPPAAYPVCAGCHRQLHARFRSPLRWQSFLQFVRRGWYAREVTAKQIQSQVELGPQYLWAALSHAVPERSTSHAWWWEALTVDPASLQSPAARIQR